MCTDEMRLFANFSHVYVGYKQHGLLCCMDKKLEIRKLLVCAHLQKGACSPLSWHIAIFSAPFCTCSLSNKLIFFTFLSIKYRSPITSKHVQKRPNLSKHIQTHLHTSKYVQCSKIFIISNKISGKICLITYSRLCKVLQLSYVLFLLGFAM